MQAQQKQCKFSLMIYLCLHYLNCFASLHCEEIDPALETPSGPNGLKISTHTLRDSLKKFNQIFDILLFAIFCP